MDQEILLEKSPNKPAFVGIHHKSMIQLEGGDYFVPCGGCSLDFLQLEEILPFFILSSCGEGRDFLYY